MEAGVAVQTPAARAARAALARGDLLTAYDIARRTDEEGDLRYLEVLTLARLGDHEQALRLYTAYHLDARIDVEALSLRARLYKDLGYVRPGAPDTELLKVACRLYAAVQARTGEAYPAINAATLAFILGRKRLAAQMARAAASRAAASGHRDYFTMATVMEARLILGDLAGAREALAQALASPDADVGKRSTTILQMQRLLPRLSGSAEAAEDILQTLRAPAVLSYRGTIFEEDPVAEAALTEKIDEALRRNKVGIAYGSLAAGSDILVAERLIAAGAELHVVLPVAEADFVARSVAQAGGAWPERYRACREAAATVTFASNMSHVGGKGQFAYGSRVAMGMARLRARHLHGEAVQLAVWERSAGAGALTHSEVKAWGAMGGRTIVVEADGVRRPPPSPPPSGQEVQRGTYGLMFTDFPGFSRLDERALPAFQDEIMRRAADCLALRKDTIRQKNSWGDAIYVVFEGVREAAEAALDLCDGLRRADGGRLGLVHDPAMRIALHFGPTYVDIDPITERLDHYGSEVSRAARIEPVTPPGNVYVTGSFAAILAMEPGHDMRCDYVGQVELPKGYGTHPLYRLRR